MAQTLHRETFRTSRELDFFSEKELVAQIGHDIEEWPLVAIKELIDNSLDVCEEHDITPEIHVAGDAAGIAVSDNGPGLPDDTLAGILDFTVRASSREAYVAPDRGAQGNALKTLVSMPYVVDPKHGKLIVISCGKRREIRCGADPVTQRAVIHCNPTPSNGKPGTIVRLEWARVAEKTCQGNRALWPFGNDCDPLDNESYRGWHPLRVRAFSLFRTFALFNPHLTLSVDWFGDTWKAKATDPTWQKWKPNHPTSIHWYERAHFERLIGAYIALDRERRTSRTVASFVSEFDGLSGSQKRKQVLAECDLLREPLVALIDENGFRSEIVLNLLRAMKDNTKPIKPARLGIIGKDHFLTKFTELGCDPKHFEYFKKANFDDGLPYVLETAFSWRGEGAADQREINAAANWSAAIKNPFRSFGSTGEGLEAHLTELKAGAREPIVFALHLAHPRIQYTDRGKSAIAVKGGAQ